MQILGKDSHLATFLERSEAPVRPAKLKKGWLSGVKDKWDARNYSAKDCDEWFGKERDWALAYNTNIKYVISLTAPLSVILGSIKGKGNIFKGKIIYFS